MIYYQDDLVTLHHGDCFDVQDWLDADVMIVDPPYGMGYKKIYTTWPHMGAQRGEFVYDNRVESDENAGVRDEIIRLWKKSGFQKPALCFGTWKVGKPRGVKNCLVWDKGKNPGQGHSDLPWGSSYEEIYVYGVGWDTPRTGNVLHFDRWNGRDNNRPKHPTPKPPELMEYLVSATPPGVITDPCAGSGSTLVAAKRLGRLSVGIETNERYCEMAANRLTSEVAQGIFIV